MNRLVSLPLWRECSPRWPGTGGGSACLSLQVQQGLLPCPRLRAWAALCPQAGRPLLTDPCCTPLSGCSWPGQSQALTGLFRSEERVRGEGKGEGEGRGGQVGSWEQRAGPPGADASPSAPGTPARAHACRLVTHLPFLLSFC